MYNNIIVTSLKITLLSLAGGTYKYLQDTGAFDQTTELLEDGSIKALETFGESAAEAIHELCSKERTNIYPLAALGTAIGIWFFFDSIIDYDENGSIEFRIPVLIDRYIDA